MFTNVNLSAPVGALALLGAALLFVMLVIAFVYGLISQRVFLARGVLLVAVISAATYLGIMLIFSFASAENVLARGQEKHFCEIDCHLAYSIDDVKLAKTLGSGANTANAAGNFYLITVRTRFDENTISPTRGDAPLTPNSRVVTMLDDQGQSFFPSPAGENALAEGCGTDLRTPLRPGQSYTTTLVFDLPADVRNPTLLITGGEWLTYFVIGHENSPLHKKTRFQIRA